MKEVIAIIRPEKAIATLEAVRQMGIEEAIEQRVLGRGRQGGLRYLRPGTAGQPEESIRFLPKRMLSWWVSEEELETLVETIARINCTSSYGDGKIFICPMDIMQ